MIRGLPASKVRAIVEGVAPKLDVFVNGSTEVNVGRARQCASVARPKTSDAEPEVRLLDTGEILALRDQLPRNVEPPEVLFSLFVQLEQDLGPEVRRQALETIDSLTRRARWKMDAAAVEVPGDKIRDLHATPGVSYVEPGQTLRAPEPIVNEPAAPPHADLRRIATQARRHGYGEGVLVGHHRRGRVRLRP